jgi:hypothetical protein
MLGPNAQKVIEYRQKYPCITTVEIALKVGVSPQRVQAILSKYGLPTKGATRPCRVCGKQCRSQNKTRICPECRHAAVWIQIECHTCGKLFPIRAKRLLNNYSHGSENVHCSKECYRVANKKPRKRKKVRAGSPGQM